MMRFTPLLLLATGCGANLFTLEDDIELGAQLRDEILGSPDLYPVVPEAEAPEAYANLRRIRDEVLASGEVEHAEDFEWEVYLLQEDTLNAFAAPGGYMFFYSGLMQYLDEEDHFAGVMGHEMGHAAARHSTEQMTEAYGLSTLISVALGDSDGATIAQLAAGLASLQFSRTDEAESDELSVTYLCESLYAADGASGFFAKIEAEGAAGGTPEWLSSHPSPANRVEDIRARAVELGCDTTPSGQNWAAVQATLP